jgi:hypothetical protein
MEQKYKYTLEKILQHLIALEEHFRDFACWEDCLPKHLLALQMYLEEMTTFCFPNDRHYWLALKTRSAVWANEMTKGNELIYADQLRTLRKEIMTKFFVTDFLQRVGQTKRGQCCP